MTWSCGVEWRNNKNPVPVITLDPTLPALAIARVGHRGSSRGMRWTQARELVATVCCCLVRVNELPEIGDVGAFTGTDTTDSIT